MASTDLTRTHTVATADERKKHTFSAWIKLSTTGTFFANRPSSSYRFYYMILPSGHASEYQFYCYMVYNGSAMLEATGTRKFRDVNGWYHIVVRTDTTQGTGADRFRVYINGEQETLTFGHTPDQNEELQVNRDTTHYIGEEGNGNNQFDGSMSHIHFCDGYSYAPTEFGETDSTTGEWKIKTSPSVSYGTNGFFILKDGNSVTDQSGNSHNWAVNGGTLTKTEDSPSNVFATLNPLDMYYGNSTLSNGNNTQNQSASSGNYAYIPSTLGFNSGKWYWEMKCVSGHSDNWYGTGITSSQVNANNNWLGQNANDYSLYGYSYGGGLGASYTGGTRTNQGLSFTAGDIIGVAVDCDNLAIYFSKNGTWMSNASSTQGVPTSGGSKTGSFYTITAPSSTTIGFYFPALCYYDAQNAVQQTNFGNGYFGTTAVSSAGTNASGIGIFEYDVPTGYTALSTKGLNL